MEPIAITRGDDVLAKKGVFANVLTTDGDSKAATRTRNYNKKYKRSALNGKDANHANKNWGKSLDSKKKKGRSIYKILKDETDHIYHDDMVVQQCGCR